MKKLALMAAVTAASLMFAAGTGEARMDRAQRAELCPLTAQPMCAYGMPECGPHGWRCAAPTTWGQPNNRRGDSCTGNIGPNCMYPAMPTCRNGRWVCQAPRSNSY